jgi:hypothetical protein
MLEIAMKTCPLAPAPSAPNAQNPFHLPSKERKAFEALNTRKTVLRKAINAAYNGLPTPPQLAALYPALADTQAQDWFEKAAEQHQADRSAQRHIVSRHRRVHASKAARKFAALMQSNRRKAYRTLYGGKAPQLTVLRHDGELHTDADDILVALAAQYRQNLTPAAVDAADPAPWLPEHPEQTTDPLDPFTPPPHAIPDSHKRLYATYDQDVFDKALAAASNNRAEGPVTSPWSC